MILGIIKYRDFFVINKKIYINVIQYYWVIYMENLKVKIILENNKEIEVELYEEYAPISVKNFLELVDKSFYDGVIFHRVIKDFMIQTGGYAVIDNTLVDKETDKTIKGEFSMNGVNNPLKHELGVISMARTSDPNSASSQFFICSTACPHLDGQYAAFGKVTNEESLKNVLEISNVETINIGYGFSDFPKDIIRIKTIIRCN